MDPLRTIPFVPEYSDVKVNCEFVVIKNTHLNEIYLFCAKHNDVIKNFAVVMSVVVKRVDCISLFIKPEK